MFFAVPLTDGHNKAYRLRDITMVAETSSPGVSTISVFSLEGGGVETVFVAMSFSDLVRHLNDASILNK